MRNNQLSAFTLFELLLVMILISIIVTILGSAFYNVNSFHKRLRDRVDQVGSFKEVKYAISRDFNRMKFYHVASDKLVFSDGIDTVLYSFGEQTVRQQGVRVDSIMLQSALSFSDSTASVVLLLGERRTTIRLPSVNSGVLSYKASDSEKTEVNRE